MLRHSPHADQRVAAAAQHQLLQIPDLASGPLPATPRRSVAAAAVRSPRLVANRSASQSRTSSSGPFTTTQHEPAHRPYPSRSSWRPTCPSVPASSVTVASQAHLTHVSTLSGRASGPYPASYAGRPLEEPAVMSRFPAAFRPPAFASWVILSPAAGFRLPHGRPTECRHSPGPHRGSHVPHEEIRPGWAPPIPRDGGVLPADQASSAAPAASQRPALYPTETSHRRSPHDEASTRGSLAFTRPVFPFTCNPRWNGSPWALPPGLRTPQLPTTHARRGRPLSTGPDPHLRHQSNLLIGEFTHLVRPRVARRTRGH